MALEKAHESIIYYKIHRAELLESIAGNSLALKKKKKVSSFVLNLPKGLN